ncbi:hypothetical protein AKJ16_DCAP27172 [Drosera capensis]
MSHLTAIETLDVAFVTAAAAGASRTFLAYCIIAVSIVPSATSFSPLAFASTPKNTFTPPFPLFFLSPAPLLSPPLNFSSSLDLWSQGWSCSTFSSKARSSFAVAGFEKAAAGSGTILINTTVQCDKFQELKTFQEEVEGSQDSEHSPPSKSELFLETTGDCVETGFATSCFMRNQLEVEAVLNALYC